jgi:molybdopterin converting factor small subunit
VEQDLESATTGRAPVVTIRYWAAIRAVAGIAEERYEVATLDALLTAARQRHADVPRFASVLGICSLLVGEQPLGNRNASEVALRDGDVVDALPPFAGG